jgi:hypothetical protein
MQIERVNLKIQPIEDKRLDEAQHRLAEKRINAHLDRTLIQQAQHTRPEDQRDKRIRPLNPMLDIRGGEKLQAPLPRLGHEPRERRPRPLDKNHGRLPKQIEQDRRPDKRLPLRLRHTHAAHPQRGWNQ